MEWATNSISPQTEVVHNLGCIKKYPTTAAELRPTWLWRWKCTGERGQETSEPDGQEVSQWRDTAFHISKVFSQKLFKKKQLLKMSSLHEWPMEDIGWPCILTRSTVWTPREKMLTYSFIQGSFNCWIGPCFPAQIFEYIIIYIYISEYITAKPRYCIYIPQHCIKTFCPTIVFPPVLRYIINTVFLCLFTAPLGPGELTVPGKLPVQLVCCLWSITLLSLVVNGDTYLAETDPWTTLNPSVLIEFPTATDGASYSLTS